VRAVKIIRFLKALILTFSRITGRRNQNRREIQSDRVQGHEGFGRELSRTEHDEFMAARASPLNYLATNIPMAGWPERRSEKAFTKITTPHPPTAQEYSSVFRWKRGEVARN
jgi:hypothetical protein